MATDLYDATLAALSKWVDDYNSWRDTETQAWGRVSKIGEEFGEVIQAMIGWTDQNPRKGQTHTIEHVIDELADVAITALGAIEHLTDNQGRARSIVDEKIKAVGDRAGVVTR